MKGHEVRFIEQNVSYKSGKEGSMVNVVSSSPEVWESPPIKRPRHQIEFLSTLKM